MLKKSFRSLNGLCLLLAVLALAACGSDTPERGEGEPPLFIIGTNPEYPPMQFVDPETSDMVGYEIDLMEAIAEAGGFDIEWRSIEWKGIFGSLEMGDIDAIMSAATITEERQQRFDFSDPYFTISQRLIVRRAEADQIAEISDLNDKEIGVQMGTTGQLMVEAEFPHWSTKAYDNAPLAFADLAAGSVFGFMVDGPVAEEYGRANPQSAELFEPLPFDFSEEHYGIVVQKNRPEFLSMINEGLRKVQEAGIDSDLKEKWIK